MLDRFRGAPEAADDDRPEDWVGSATSTWTVPGRATSNLGVSSVTVGNRQVTLDAILAEEPEALAGRALVERAGPTLGVLVKLLDAGERLPVHCHPSRELAASLLGSRFGKTEAWIILATRDGGPASVWAGFREAVPTELLRGWIERQDTVAMLDALIEHRVTAGDVLLIGAGMPHAIGAGVFLLELQEPTDFSVVAEMRGFPVDAHDATLGLGWDVALDFFDTEAASGPRQRSTEGGGDVLGLLGPAADPFFRAVRQTVRGEAGAPFEPAYAVGVVTGGRGEIRGERAAIGLEPGVTFALPAAATASARLAGDDVEVTWCLGPDPAALERATSSPAA
jgi:mannose-6-phosphate isomerase